MVILCDDTRCGQKHRECAVVAGVSDTLHVVNDTFVGAMTIVGLVAGGALDPIGQQLAQRSRAAEVRLRADSEAERAARAGADTPGRAVVEEVDSLDVAPARHLVVEGRSTTRTLIAAAVTGALFGGLAAEFGSDLVVAPLAVFFAALVMVSMTDLSYRLVPRWVIYGSGALIAPLLVAAAAVDHQWHHLPGAALSGGVAFAVFFAIWWFMPRGMGFGDVRLAGIIGVTTGYLSVLHAYLAFLSGFLLGLFFGVVMMMVLASGRKTRIPFAPALAAGAVLAVFYGGHLSRSLFGAGS